MDGFDHCSRSVHLDVCRALPPEEVEQQLAWRSGDGHGRFPPPCSNGLGGPLPLKLKTGASQPPREEPGRLTDVAPKGLVHVVVVRSRTATVGSAYVLVVDEELVEVREPAHPSDAEEARRRSRSDCRNEPCEIFEREGASSSFREAFPRTRDDQAGASEGVVLAEDEVCGEIAGRPRLQESGCLRAELVEQIAQLRSLDGVEERIVHIAERSEPAKSRPPLLAIDNSTRANSGAADTRTGRDEPAPFGTNDRPVGYCSAPTAVPAEKPRAPGLLSIVPG